MTMPNRRFQPLEFFPLAKSRPQPEINVTGQVAVTQKLLPLVRQATGRIVFISSIGDRMPCHSRAR